MKRKVKIAVIAIAALILLTLAFVSLRNFINSPSCFMGGGALRLFSNTCVDSCDLVRSEEPPLCGQAFTEGCDCGPARCWNGNSCELN